MTTRLTFQIELSSDYHISAGHGHGAVIDSALLREADSTPVIRGTTLAGLLRDGLWRLMQLEPMQAHHAPLCQASGHEDGPAYCGQHQPDEPRCPLCRLLGTPARPRHWQISSARPVGQETVSVDRWQQGSTGSQVAQRARINPRTRRTEPRKLFSQEEGTAGLTFVFTISTLLDGPGALDEAALWVASARMVRQLGRSRRRGQGECLFKLIRLESDAGEAQSPSKQAQSWLLERFDQRWLNNQLAPLPEPAKQTISAATQPPAPDAPLRFRLLLRTDEPVIIAKRSEAGNQFETLPVITGQVIRGMLAWRAARQFNLRDKNSEIYARFARLFLRGGVIFPMLQPAQRTAGGTTCYPAIPAPRNWLTCKTVGGLPDEGHGMHVAGDDATTRCPECKDPLQPRSNEFVVLSDFPGNWKDTKFLFTPSQRSELHVELDPHTGRAKENQLYAYTALDAGQYFVGDLVCQTGTDWQLLQEFTGLSEKTPLTVRLGKASRRGYGGATLWLEKLDASRPRTWAGQTPEQRLPDPDDIKLTFLTDTIITDRWGRFMDGFQAGWVSEALGMSVELLPNSASARSGPVDGFNALHGLPRWRDLALQAGSAVRLRLVGPPHDWVERLRRLEFEGIGLRRNEGFGQIVFNHPLYHAQAIDGSSIILAPAMRLGAGNQPHQSLEKELFVKEWQDVLDKDPDAWNSCKDPRFTAVARWLHHKAGTPPDELATQLTKLGQPDPALVEAITRPEYGDRDKENKLSTTCKRGVDLITAHLKELAERESDQLFWPLGVQMLAEQVADSVKQKGEEQ